MLLMLLVLLLFLLLLLLLLLVLLLLRRRRHLPLERLLLCFLCLQQVAVGARWLFPCIQAPMDQNTPDMFRV